MYKFKKILFGLDLNHLSGEAFEYAIYLADRNEAKLDIVYVCPNYHLRSVDVYFPENVIEEVKSRALTSIEELCKEKVLDHIDREIHMLEENTPYQAIIKKAKELGTDLIVLGGHDRHHLDEILLGSNTEKVVRYAPCSVIVIKDQNTKL